MDDIISKFSDELIISPISDKEKEDYFCQICMSLMFNPHELNKCCGQLLCSKCFYDKQKNECPFCRCKNPEIQPTIKAKKKIMDITVKCVNHKEGCEKTDTLASMIRHDKVCDYRKINCSDCKMEVVVKDMQIHLDTQCTFKIPCQHKIWCGCNHRDTRYNMQKHITDNDLHIKLSIEYVQNLTRTHQEYVQNLNKTHQEHKQQSELTINNLTNKIDEWKDKYSSIKNNYQICKQNYANYQSKQNKGDEYVLQAIKKNTDYFYRALQRIKNDDENSQSLTYNAVSNLLCEVLNVYENIDCDKDSDLYYNLSNLNEKLNMTIQMIVNKHYSNATIKSLYYLANEYDSIDDPKVLQYI